MHIGSVITENLKYTEVAKEYEEEVLVVGVPKASTNFDRFLPKAEPAKVHNSYFSTFIMFIYALSSDLRRRIYTI